MFSKGNKQRPAVHPTAELSFAAKDLVLEGLVANINIQPRTGTAIKIKADEDVLKTLNFVQLKDNDTLTVKAKPSQGGTVYGETGQSEVNVVAVNCSGGIVGGTNNTVFNYFGGSSFVQTSNMPTSGTVRKSTPSVEITVPTETAITIDGCCGNVVVGDVNGNLHTYIAAGSVTASMVKKLKVEISGQGTATVGCVNGDARLRISGRGTIQVDSGQIDDLEAKVSGSGDICVKAEAQDADLNVTGEGTIYVQKVKGDLHRRVKGRGGIRVPNH